MKLSKEEKFIKKLIFDKKKTTYPEISSLDLGDLIYKSSSHLILPLLYLKILENNLVQNFPDDFIKYIKEIYELNKKRNLVLLKEIKQLSQLFNKYKIKHVFLKGSAMILNDFYDDVGERMIGDIDFLVEKKKVSFTEKILEKNNYHKISDYDFFDYRHEVRRIKKNKVFAIELHTELTDKKQLIESKRFIEDSIFHNGYLVPNFNDLFIHNVYNYQINDKGFEKFSYSIRSLYDTKKIFDRVNKISLEKKHNNILFRSYFFIAKKLNYNLSFVCVFDKFSLSHNYMKFVLSFRLTYYIHFYMFMVYSLFISKSTKLFYFMFRKKYRDYILNKISLFLIYPFFKIFIY